MPNIFERFGQGIHVRKASTDTLRREYTRFHELRTQLPQHADVYNWRIASTRAGLRRKGLTEKEIKELVSK